MQIQWLFRSEQCERDRRINDLLSYIFGNQRAALSHPSTVNGLVGIIAKNASDMLVAPSWTWESMERQWCSALHCRQSKGCATTLTHTRTIWIYWMQESLRRHCYDVPKISINGAPTECQLSADNFQTCNFHNPRAVHWHWPIIKGLATSMGKNARNNSATGSKN